MEGSCARLQKLGDSRSLKASDGCGHCREPPLVSSDGWRRISERYCRSCHPCLSAWLNSPRAGGRTNPAILWRYAGTSSTRLSRCRLRAAAEFHGAGRHPADTEARRAQACPLARAEAEYTSSGAASSRAAAAGEESVRRDEDTRTAQEDTRTAQADTRTGGLEGRARSAAVRARHQQRGRIHPALPRARSAEIVPTRLAEVGHESLPSHDAWPSWVAVLALLASAESFLLVRLARPLRVRSPSSAPSAAPPREHTPQRRRRATAIPRTRMTSAASPPRGGGSAHRSAAHAGHSP